MNVCVCVFGRLSTYSLAILFLCVFICSCSVWVILYVFVCDPFLLVCVSVCLFVRDVVFVFVSSCNQVYAWLSAGALSVCCLCTLVCTITYLLSWMFFGLLTAVLRLLEVFRACLFIRFFSCLFV